MIKYHKTHNSKDIPMEKIIELRREGMTYEEISVKLGCSYSNIMHRIQRYEKENGKIK